MNRIEQSETTRRDMKTVGWGVDGMGRPADGLSRQLLKANVSLICARGDIQPNHPGDGRVERVGHERVLVDRKLATVPASSEALPLKLNAIRRKAKHRAQLERSSFRATRRTVSDYMHLLLNQDLNGRCFAPRLVSPGAKRLSNYHPRTRCVRTQSGWGSGLG
jgi:hypothetical protein